MKIIVTGSLGNIGKPLAETLVQKGHMVTVVSHSPERQPEIEALGAGAAIGSVQDAGFVASTFVGADAVFVMVPPNFRVSDLMAYCREVGNNYAGAVQAAGVKRVVYLSSWGAHLSEGTGGILAAHEVEGILGELSGVAITFLRPTYFYSNLYGYVGMIKQQGAITANYGGDDKIPMVAPGDIAAAAAEELESSSSGKNVRYVASDEHTANEVAHILGAAIGRPDLAWVTISDEQMTSNLEAAGLPPHTVPLMVDMYASIHSGAMGEDYEQHKPVMGKVKLEDFAEEFAAAF